MGIGSSMKIRSFKLKLIFSYAFVILVSLGVIFAFLDKDLQVIFSSDIKSTFLSLLLIVGLAFILGSFAASRIINSVNRMMQASRNEMAHEIENKVREIRAQNQKFAAIFNSMVEGVIVIDKTGHISSINPTVENIFGVLKKDAIGKIFLEAVRNNDMAEVISTILKNGMPVFKEMVLVYPVRGIFEVSATPVFDNDAISGCLLVIHDITEIRALEKMRSDFVANVSHELKTPLTSIKGFVETLLEGALDDKENNRNFLKIIQEHTERLNSLVEDLLSLSHLESKEITLVKSSFDLSQQLQKVLMGFDAQAKKMNIDIKNDMPAGLTVSADKNRIEQVFTNLIDNAVKFNNKNGTIRIYSEEESGKIKVFVEDSGMGIPPKDIPRIFERFYRVDKARSRELGGTGLGLSIVKHIIELHNGSIGVESTECFGSKFWFMLPK